MAWFILVRLLFLAGVVWAAGASDDAADCGVSVCSLMGRLLAYMGISQHEHRHA